MTTKWNIPFVKLSNRFFMISGVLMALILIFSFILGVDLAIEFRGGAIITYAFEGDLDRAAFESVAQQITDATITVREVQSLVPGSAEVNETMVITLPGTISLTSEQIILLNEGLVEAFPENNIRNFQTDNVDATMGAEFLAKSMTAIALASVFMVIYVAFRFRKIGGMSAGVMAVVGLLHDIAIVYGAFLFFRFPISINFMAVVLTILGYSLNDTIIVYDRIRENRRLYGSKLTLEELVDRSTNQCLTRSIHTSITTILAMLVVAIVALIFNVQVIVTFALPIIVGLISGTYSTLCIAGPLWVKWRNYRDAKA